MKTPAGLRAKIAVLFSSLVAVCGAAEYDSVAFPPEVHAARRAALMESAGDGVVIVPGRYLANYPIAPRQDADFWYLTGVESPYSILVIVNTEDSVRELLFLPDEFQFAPYNYPQNDLRFRNATWNRPQFPSPGTDAVSETGIREIYPIDEFRQRLIDVVGERQRILFADGGESLYAPPGITPPLTINQSLRNELAALFPNARFENPSTDIRRMRMVKDEHEIERIRRATNISIESLKEAARAIRPGVTPLEIAGLIEYVWTREGGQGYTVGRNVSSGENSLLHYPLVFAMYNVGNYQMRDGELAFLDYGLSQSDMYFSDLSRTYPVSGKFSPEQRMYYEIMLEATDAAIAAVEPGATMLDAIKAAATVFKNHGLERYEDIDTMGIDNVWGIFPSPTHFIDEDGNSGPDNVWVRALGHGIGINIVAEIDNDTILRPGMVFTVEPKLYSPELGSAIMIEDMILVTEDGRENLSAALPRTPDEVEALMAEPSRISNQ